VSLQNLTSLGIQGLSLSGPFPTFWDSFPNLCYLKIRNTNLSGPLPLSLASLGVGPMCADSDINFVGGVLLDLSFNALEGKSRSH